MNFITLNNFNKRETLQWIKEAFADVATMVKNNVNITDLGYTPLYKKHHLLKLRI